MNGFTPDDSSLIVTASDCVPNGTGAFGEEMGFGVLTKRDILRMSSKLSARGLTPTIHIFDHPNGKEAAYILECPKFAQTCFDDEDEYQQLFSNLANLEYSTTRFVHGRHVPFAHYHELIINTGEQQLFQEPGSKLHLVSDINNFEKMFGAIQTLSGLRNSTLSTNVHRFFHTDLCGQFFKGKDKGTYGSLKIFLGTSPLPISFQYFQHGNPVGDRLKIITKNGTLLVMCERAAGVGWRNHNACCVRHAIGNERFAIENNVLRQRVIKSKAQLYARRPQLSPHEKLAKKNAFLSQQKHRRLARHFASSKERDEPPPKKKTKRVSFDETKNNVHQIPSSTDSIESITA